MAIAKFEIENSFSTGKEGFDPERDQRERLISHAHKQGHEEGFKTGHAQAMSEIEARTATLMEQMNGVLNALFQDRKATETRLEAESALMAKLIGNKLARSLLEDQPQAEVASLIRECLLAGYNQPKIVARVAPQLKESIESRIETMKMAAGYVGELEIVVNEEAGEQDCTVEWPNGGMTRNFQGLIEEIDNRISAYIGTPLDELEKALIPEPKPDITASEEIEPELLAEDAAKEAASADAAGEETLEPAPELVQELDSELAPETEMENVSQTDQETDQKDD